MQCRIFERFGPSLAAMALAGSCLGVLGFAPHSALAGQTDATLPASLRPALYDALVVHRKAVPATHEHCAHHPSHVHLKACFDSRGAHFTGPGKQALSLRLTAFGRAGDLRPLRAAKEERSDGRVRYRYRALTEWWRAVPNGFEQGFTVERRPAGSARLTVALMANRRPTQTGGSLAWDALHYGGLVVMDARGRQLPARIAARGRRIVIGVDDRAAVYPLTIDPLVWIQQRVRTPAPVTAPGSAGSAAIASAFGASVVLDGETAFAGAPFTTVAGVVQQGAVYVFSESSNRSWKQSGLLTAADGEAYDQFGSRLAASGTTLMVGAPGAAVAGNAAQGAVYVFAPAAGTWTQAQKLTASDGAAGDEFGSALALSGAAALIGARYAKVGANGRQGAAYVFARSAGTWSEAQKLTASDGAADDLFGSAVALDGARALIGAPAASAGGNDLAGAVYAFAGEAGSWNETQKLEASDGAAGDSFGAALALDGSMALVGAPEATVSGRINQGEVYAFDDSGGTWTLSSKLIAGDGGRADQFGVALALEGDRALVGDGGGGGHAYLFGSAGGSWMQRQEFSGGTNYGKALAIEGRSLLVGQPSSGAGTIYFYEPTNLALTYEVPSVVKPKATYDGNAILTNNAATDSPPLSLLVLTPTGASIGTAASTQGDCSVRSAAAACTLGQVAGNGGEARVNVKFTVTAKPPASLANSAEVVNAVPAVTAHAVVSVPKKKSSGGGGELGLGLLGLLGLLAAAGWVRRRR